MAAEGESTSPNSRTAEGDTIASNIALEHVDDVHMLLPKVKKFAEGNTICLCDSPNVRITKSYRTFEEEVASNFSQKWSNAHEKCEGACRRIATSDKITFFEIAGHPDHATKDLRLALPVRYEPLPPQPASIRLLNIKAADHTSIVECELITVPLEAQTKYAALSYVWGDHPAEKVILCNGKPIAIRPNLQDALLRYRLSNWNGNRNEFQFLLPLWVDALCINQEDHEEKKHQILLMERIYSQAQRVFVNLGKVPLDWFPGYLLLLRLAHTWDKFYANGKMDNSGGPSSISQLLSKYDLPPFEYEGWLKYYYIFNSPWFLRTWVIQEISLARRATIMYGSFFFDWDYLAKAMIFCGRYELKNRREDVRLHSYYYGVRAVSHMINMRSGCQLPRDICLAHFAAEILRHQLPAEKTASVKFQRADNARIYDIKIVIHSKLSSQKVEREMVNPTENTALVQEFERYHQRKDGFPAVAKDFEQWYMAETGHYAVERASLQNEPLAVMTSGRIFNVTNPKDKIFGVLGILYGLGDGFKPHYSMTAAEVYHHLAAHYISMNAGKNWRSIGILSFAGLQRRSQVLNIPSWVPDWTSDTLDPREFCILQGRNFQAATSAEASIRIMHNTSKLSVKGLFFDETAAVTPKFPDSKGVPPGEKAGDFVEWHKHADNIYHRACKENKSVYTDPFDAYCRTLIADPKIEDYSKGGYVGLNEAAITNPKVSHDSAWAILEAEGLVPWESRKLGAAGTHISQIAVAAGSRSFAATKSGRMALVPWCAKEGDKICMLLGGKTPFVVRGDLSSESYVLIGDAYVHGVMYGEALDLGFSMEEIVLV